jgi:predicted methyltransferase
LAFHDFRIARYAMNRTLLLAVLVVALAACQQQAPPVAQAPASAPAPVPAAALAPTFGDKIDAALAGAWRSDANKARDQYRHPRETLEFFGLHANMIVVEISPGAGWYTEVLGPVYAEQGKLVAAIWDDSAPDAPKYFKVNNDLLRGKVAAHPDMLGKVVLRTFDTKAPSFGPSDTADAVVTFRNVHNWTNDGMAEAYFKALHDVLKPGGILGIEEHRANPGTDAATSAKNGYVSEEYVIKLATDAGFALAAKSEINANPKDTKDHPEGVWTLPPTLALKEQDRDKYVAIGESDRMTLKFVKADKPGAAAEPATSADSFEAREEEAKPAGG